MSDPIVDRIAAIARQLDDEALIALANKGLLRRARKDCGKAMPECRGAEGDELVFATGGHSVRLSQEPGRSRCDCPAEGVCRHIIGAWIAAAGLAGDTATETAAGPTDSATDISAEIAAIGDAELRDWCGTAMLKRCLAELAKGLGHSFDATSGEIHLPEWSETVRWLPGLGLGGCLCSCHSTGPCHHRVAAILAVQVAQGARSISIDDPLLSTAGGVVRSREDILAACEHMLVDILVHGLGNIAGSSIDRLRTLATSAHGVDLPRLERDIAALAGELSLLHARHAQADSAVAMRRLTRLAALCRALHAPRPGIVGRHRGRYVRVGTLDLAGVGARPFQTRSGFTGLTCYFLDRSSGRWATWTAVRPSEQGIDPVQTFGEPGPWEGCASPAKAAGSMLRLANAWRSETGRLSGRSSCQALIRGPTTPGELPAFGNWSQLEPVIRAAYPGGFTDRDEGAGLVLLRVAQWRKDGIDDIAQCWRGAVIDEQGCELPLVIPGEQQAHAAIADIDSRELDPWPLLFGRLQLRDGHACLEPISLLGGKVHSLGLSAGGKTAARAGGALTGGNDDESADSLTDDSLTDDNEALGGSDVVSHCLDRIADHCTAIAERGCAQGAGGDAPWNQELAILDEAGSTLIAARLTATSTSLQGTDRAARARALLATAYLINETRQDYLVEQAIRQLTP